MTARRTAAGGGETDDGAAGEEDAGGGGNNFRTNFGRTRIDDWRRHIIFSTKSLEHERVGGGGSPPARFLFTLRGSDPPARDRDAEAPGPVRAAARRRRR